MVFLPQPLLPREAIGTKEPVSPKSYKNVIEAIGFGTPQAIAAILCGFIWAADGAELLLLGSVTKSVADEWSLQAWQRGSIVSVVFVGILLGNTIGGPLGDSTGRKIPVLLSFLGIILFSVLSASCGGFWSLALVRTCVGASFGLGQPATLAMIKDITPERWHLVVNVLIVGLPFCYGELYSAFLIWLDDPRMKDLDWRWLCIMGAVPSIIGFALAYTFLKESPAYLMDNGYVDEAKEILECYKQANQSEHVCCDLVASSALGRTPRSARQNVQAIFSPALRWTTISLVYTCFMLNFCFYGSLYAFPQVFRDIPTPYSPAMALVVGAIMEIPGTLSAPLLASFLDHKTLLRIFPFGVAMALLMFLVGVLGEGSVYSMLLQVGYAGTKFLACSFWALVYKCASSVFPATVRATGAAACVAGGRLGGIISPLVFEQFVLIFGSWAGFFIFMIGGQLLNGTILMAVNLEDVEDIDALDEMKPVLGSAQAA